MTDPSGGSSARRWTRRAVIVAGLAAPWGTGVPPGADIDDRARRRGALGRALRVEHPVVYAALRRGIAPGDAMPDHLFVAGWHLAPGDVRACVAACGPTIDDA